MSENIAITKITNERAEEIQALPALSTFLPYTFAESGYKLSKVAICCAVCKQELGPEDIKVKVAEFSHALSIDAFGMCIPCKTITPSRSRIGDGGEFMACDAEGNWKKGSITDEKSGWFTRLKEMFSNKDINQN